MTRRCTFALLIPAILAAATDFESAVQPILRKKCLGCHGSAMQTSGVRFDDGTAALKGGYSGPIIVPGKAAESKLIERVTSTKDGFRMPPAGAALTAAEVTTLRNWINEGAVWPASANRAAAAPAKPTHWSFQPVKSTAPPASKHPSAVNGIDHFIAARLEKENVPPSPEAPRTTLLRRLSLDLTGLPPTPREVADFLADTTPGAYERQVDRLLASPHYGERWARHWLDLAHYADSDGYEKDLVREWAWRYRHWLINALNRDLPFDRFTLEQLAGDLLPDADTSTRVATGFLRQTLTNREAGVDRDEARFEQLINRTNTIGTVWMGLAVGCSQCHDHKYDPISQRDYYSLMSFVDHADERDIDAPLPGELGPYLAALPGYEKKRKALLDEYEVPALLATWQTRMRDAIENPGRTPEWDFALTSMKAMFDRAVPVVMASPADRDPRDQKRLEEYMVYRNFTNVGLDKDKMERLKELRKKLDALDATLPRFSQAYVMIEDTERAPTAIRIRGDWKSLGVPVDSAIPAVFGKLPSGPANRLALARWLVSRDNPLTARVFVNRIWGELFGRALVRTTEDFGKQGEAPTHPELLDWLASEFMNNGWSMKQLQKTIVMSHTYRQDSRVRPEIQQRDPENTLLARQTRVRLSAELVRDAALAASGLLSDDIGGPSVRPPQPEGIAELGYGNSVKWKTDSGEARYRRGLYVHFQRTTPYPMLMTFDSPDSNVSCTRRARSNTALQALNLLNDEVFFEAAQAMAWRVEREAAPAVAERIDYAFRLTLGRAPTAAERTRLAAYHDTQSQIAEREGSGAMSPWTGLARVLLNTDEFITRE